MNTLERRQIARGQVIDMVVAKTAVTKSRREATQGARGQPLRQAASRDNFLSACLRGAD